MSEKSYSKIFCANCNLDISTCGVYIKCAECENVELCLQCFSSGIEFGRHMKTHKYSINDNGTFSLFDPTWSAVEEQLLIDSVEQYGLGNWDEVAANIESKTAKQVEEHYMIIYVDGYLGRLTVPADIPNRMTDHTPPIHESTFSVQLPQVHVTKQEQLDLAYMPNRDDFEYEFDNDAESLVSSLFMNHEDNDLDKGLKLSKVDMYHTRLKERQRRKDISREYKLVEKFFFKGIKNMCTSKYERETRLKLRCCSQFMKCEQLDKLMNGLVRERQLRRKISKLKNYRRNGITRFEACSSFDAANYRRERNKNLSEKESSNSSDKLPRSDSDLKCQPGYSMLGGREKLLCHGMKLPPDRYLTAKVLVFKDAIHKQHYGQNKPKYSTSVEKSHRRRILSFFKENGWIF